MTIIQIIGVAALSFLTRGAVQATELYQLVPGVETRWASPENPKGEKGVGGQSREGRKGRPNIPLKAGETAVLAEVSGTSGTIRRIWLTPHTRTPATLRGVRIEFYWDGADRPAVNVPLGDFFGNGLGRMAAFQSALFSNPEGRSFNCNVPMPFRTGMKIRLINESTEDISMVFYDVDYTIGDKHGNDMLYFHAWFNRENPTQLQKDYTILAKLTGRGRFLGVNVGIIANKEKYYESWWGEGEVKMYLDGDTDYPTLVGTGSEDYIGTGWNLGAYSNLYQGCPYANREEMQFALYRHHVTDPVFFHQDIRVTLQQIGLWNPAITPKFRAANAKLFQLHPGEFINWNEPNFPKYGLYERSDDLSSCAYFYLDRPTNDLPPLQPVADRIRGLSSP